MQQSGEYRVAATRDAVWRALNDPEILAQCIDGCESFARSGDNAFLATVRARIGPLSAVFTGEVELADLDPPNGYTLRGSVKGGAAGFGKGKAKVALADVAGATLLRYEVDGSVGGKLAQVGQRLIDGAARKMADDFFTRFAELVDPSQVVPPPEPAEADAPSKRGLIITFAVMVAAALALVALAFPR